MKILSVTVNSSQRSSSRSVRRSLGKAFGLLPLTHFVVTSSVGAGSPRACLRQPCPVSLCLPSFPRGLLLPLVAVRRSSSQLPLSVARLVFRGAWARLPRGQFLSLLTSAFVIGPLWSGFRAQSSSCLLLVLALSALPPSAFPRCAPSSSSSLLVLEGLPRWSLIPSSIILSFSLMSSLRLIAALRAVRLFFCD